MIKSFKLPSLLGIALAIAASTYFANAQDRRAGPQQSAESRLAALEDRLAIYDVISAHPLTADTAYAPLYEKIYTENTAFDRGAAAGGGVVGRDKFIASAESKAHQAALDGGLAHFSNLPYIISIDANKAVAVSYLMLVTTNHDVPDRALSNHGTSKGHQIFRVIANRWELVKEKEGWKVSRRTLSTHDGTRPGARDLLVEEIKTRLTQ